MKRWSVAWAGALAAVTVSGAVTGAGAADAATTPTQLYVSATASSDPACGAASQANPFRTIAAALACARNGATVNIGVGHFAGELTVGVNATLVGAGAGTVIADPTVSSDLVPEVSVAAGRTVTVRNLAINGADSAGNPAHDGIRAAGGTLTVQGVDITDTVGHNGAGIDAESSTADSHVTVRNSTISNTLALQNGGGIAVVPAGSSSATLTLLNSTISGNQADGNGGALALFAGTSTISRESTIDGNSASVGGGLYLQPIAGHTATLAGTLLASNTAAGANSGPDCLATAGGGVSVISGGENLIGQDSGANGTGCAGLTDGANGDQVGTATSPINPGLAPLAGNGGPTPTQALLSGSPAIGTGNATDCENTPISNLDQRGDARRAFTRATCDIGAYDTGGISLQTLYVRHSAKSDPACAAASAANPFRTIAAALACARNGATVNIGVGHFAGELTVGVNATLVGAGAGTVIADPTVSSDLVPEVSVAAGRTVTVRNLAINGADSAGNPAHDGIRAAGGTLTVQGVDITDTVGHNGAGIDAESSTADSHVTVRNSTISNTLALQNGGGIAVVPAGSSSATLTLLNSTISGNQADGNGGALALFAGTSTISRESTIDGNSASVGGGLYLQPIAGHTATLAGTLLASNTAAGANSGPDCLATAGGGVSVISGGENLIGQDSGANGTGCAGLTDGANGDQVGTATSPINPGLAPLAGNGGPTPTQALLSGSPAIGTGNATDCENTPISNLDQRGDARRTPTRGTCDIGAYDTGGTSAA